MLQNKNNSCPLPDILPTHVGFIMDGNGRWAKKRGLPRKFGHREGSKTFKTIMNYCNDIGLKYISFYTFSTENWKRPKDEVDAIMKLFRKYLDEFWDHVDKNCRILFIGDKALFDDDIQKKMLTLENETKDCTGMTLIMAVNYGGKDEITRAVCQISENVRDGKIVPSEITEDTINSYLDTKDIPDVDLVIRPSGELRLSNYMIWQCAYAEYYFTDILWPDFTPNDLNIAFTDFASRKRRFGGV